MLWLGVGLGILAPPALRLTNMTTRAVGYVTGQPLKIKIARRGLRVIHTPETTGGAIRKRENHCYDALIY